MATKRRPKRKEKLTKRLVEAMAPGETVWDTLCQGLVVRCRSIGRTSYHVFYRTRTGQMRRPKIAQHGPQTVEEARDLAREILGQVASGKDPGGEKIAARRSESLSQFWVRFLKDARSRWKPRTLAANLRLWQKRIEPALGSIPITHLSRANLSDFHVSLLSTPVEANRCLSLLRSMLNKAKDWETIADNPAERIKLYPEKARESFLSTEQLAALIRAIDEEEALWGKPSILREGESSGQGGKGMREKESRGCSPWAAGLCRLLIGTGARLSEILNARWRWVDWEASALRLPDSKTGKKTVWLNRFAMAELGRLWEIRRQDEWIIEGKKPGSRLVGTFKFWHRIRLRAGKELKDPSLETFRLHDLRHSFASFAVAIGTPLQIVGKALGHAQARTTERYAHLADDPVRAAAEAVGELIQGAKPARILDVNNHTPESGTGTKS